jgi:hypothetical protein
MPTWEETADFYRLSKADRRFVASLFGKNGMANRNDGGIETRRSATIATKKREKIANPGLPENGKTGSRASAAAR